MEELPHKKGLHIKVALITLVGIILPLVLSTLLITNPLYSITLGILIAILSIFILFRILKPLDTLLKGTDTLRGGNLNFRVDVRSGDEFESLAESFNLMAQKLQGSFTKLEQEKDSLSSERNKLDLVLESVIDGIMAVDLGKNVVMINQAAELLTGYSLKDLQGRAIDQFIHFFNEEEEILPKAYCQINFSQILKLVGKDGKQTKVNLLTAPLSGGVQTNLSCILIVRDLSKELELEQMKLDFVSMASHELKTPLTSIVGYLSVFINENRSKLPKEELMLLDRSLVSARQLLTLVENILSVNKIEREQFSLSAEPIDYGGILTKAIEDLQNQAKLKNINLTLTLPKQSLPKVLADPVRITEVINNLVSNAIIYNNAGGRVDVSTQLTPREVITTVEDNGIGLPAVAIPYLFNKFFRVSGQLQQGSKGTGLGLYISKSIINKLNGRIWVESEMGQGSKFHFSLPQAAKASIDRNKLVDEAIKLGALNY